ncbi:hypothetical protein NIES4072_33140 [Nostoc commune NIES-4072]|uniref:Uncharacterized protein n=1 Tax=Nostoc commune NIES-4072 TaxID=2005467 RepID=A0A2R5FMY8_NOSCO|nr:hypothetical protein [Nostoc commune]BBD69355.1 hypothetical protein NIES4070_57630 [Nostoc commune HK-02]GBG19645.1 hypothetical protein NIES4072_33140 [Nostoc commune NIES-4072]
MIYSQKLQKHLAVFSLSVVLVADLAITQKTPPAFAQMVNSSIGNGVTFSCNDSEATIKAKNGPRVIKGNTTFYIGYQQVSSNNKNPITIRFNSGIKTWCRTDYETTNDDGTGYGLYWDGANVLYGVYSSTGSQTGSDFRRFATGRWLSSYGSGGGPKAAVIARINPANGQVNYATFLSAKRADNGNTNSFVVQNLSWNGTNLTVQAKSWWTPRGANTNSMTCTGSSPYQYTAVFTGDLTKVNSASAPTCK